MQSTNESVKPLCDLFTIILASVGISMCQPYLLRALTGVTNLELEMVSRVVGLTYLILPSSLWLTPRLVFWLGAQVRLAREVPILRADLQTQKAFVRGDHLRWLGLKLVISRLGNEHEVRTVAVARRELDFVKDTVLLGEVVGMDDEQASAWWRKCLEDRATEFHKITRAKHEKGKKA